ncbi:plasmid stabilization protein ParE [Thalassospira tepidiphila]|uniref:type II toxin-antitoxin system RelE/ParE family toxin n=1 Tax=Thalassospira tepidiphila TaxID=393657 RepID=UPI002923D957|nr:plasmid stabilization protein ParE [Thalassospira tepidiphila]
MANYILSQKADEDLEGIYIYSHESFGEEQAIAYFLSLRDCLNNLASSPHIGRDVSFLHPGMHCHHHKRHMVYYLIEGDGVLVVRVLHDAMDAHLHI